MLKNSITNNKTLIKLLRKGEEISFNYLIDKYHHKLCVYADSLLNDSDLAEDIVQNVFIKVWEKREFLREGTSIQSFLHKLVYNEFIDHYRKHSRVIPLEKKHIDELDFMTLEENNTHINRINEIVKLEVNRLPDKCKHIFLLSKKEGLTNVEISDHLGISTKTVEYHIAKAFKIIRNEVEAKREWIFS